MKFFIALALFLGITAVAISQDAPNVASTNSFSGNTEQESKLSSVPVNIFTGVPNVSVPIYNYANPGSGLSWSVSLSYFAGGTQLAESSSSVGLGWFLNSTGAITRTVRGMPDDYPTKGFLYAGTIPTDFRSNGDKYYFDSLDAEQDIFQYNLNGRTGQFVIGKNKQIVVIPSNKLRISYTVSASDNSTITGFRIITESGIKYDFKNVEYSSNTASGGYVSGYTNYAYATAWYLSDVISAFNNDTILFNYNSISQSVNASYPQTKYVRNSDGVVTSTYSPTGTTSISTYNINSIVFPDRKTLNFVYDPSGHTVAKIKLCDSIFRNGWALKYTTQSGNTYLSAVDPYTKSQMQKGYRFLYNSPFGPTTAADYNKIDYWGFYNGANNGTNQVPSAGNYTAGANRSPNITYALANSMSFFYLPGGGYIYYEYELNDHYPYTKQLNTVTIAGTTTSLQTNAATLSQVFNTKNQITFLLDSSVSRVGSAPISGGGTLTCYLKSSDGSVTYAANSFSLYDLFYLGIKSWTVNIPNGTYRLDAQVSSGTSITGSFPIKISWENKIYDNTHTAITAGGLRVKRVSRKDDVDDPNVTTEEYQYVNTDGTSSGFFGDIPQYNYSFTQKVVNGSTTITGYNCVNSQPVNTQNYAQGSPVGYSRVTVYKGTSSHNLGKTVYDFTNLQDINSNFSTMSFPYTPQDVRDFGLGLTKRISIYDNTGKLISKSENVYKFDTVVYNNSNFLSIKLGNSFTQYNGDPANSSTPRIRTYLAQQYYPSSGRAYLISKIDTAFQDDGSRNVDYRNYTYDTNYNVTKMVTPYDVNRSLLHETRLYYPYNYVVGGTVGRLRDSGIISIIIASEKWITGDANPRIVGGVITDMQQTVNGRVVPLTTYILQANKPILQSTIGLFDSSKINRNTTYFLPSATFVLYDSAGNLLQSKSAKTGRNSSVIVDYNKNYPIAKVVNAAYSDIAYTSFEADGTGNWTVAGSARDKTGGLTGKQSYNLSNGSVSKSGLINGLNKYVVSFWAKSGASFTINGGPPDAPIASQNGWSFYYKEMNGISSVTLSGSGIIDELRLYPKDADMITATYEPLVGITSTADANSNITYTDYDSLNRPIVIRNKDKNIIKRMTYNDHDSLITTTPFITRDTTFQWTSTTACLWDSTIYSVDNNYWSDTYQSSNTTHITGTNYCTCANSANYPQYKLIGGVCSQGSKQYSSCHSRADGNFDCVYHWIWDDCSVSGNYTEITTTAKTVTTGCIVP